MQEQEGKDWHKLGIIIPHLERSNFIFFPLNLSTRESPFPLVLTPLKRAARGRTCCSCLMVARLWRDDGDDAMQEASDYLRPRITISFSRRRLDKGAEDATAVLTRREAVTTCDRKEMSDARPSNRRLR